MLPKSDDKTLTPTVMGYKVPEGIEGFEITYTLKTTWGIADKLEQFEVTVSIKKGTETATKNIWITAKPYDFTIVKNLFNDATSSRTRAQLLSKTGTGGIIGLDVNDGVTKDQMGYTELLNITPAFTASYKMKEVLGTTSEF